MSLETRIAAQLVLEETTRQKSDAYRKFAANPTGSDAFEKERVRGEKKGEWFDASSAEWTSAINILQDFPLP